MRHKSLSLVAAAALLMSVGAAYAKDPVMLTDDQLDKVTAGDAAGITAFWVGVSTLELDGLLALSNALLIPVLNFELEIGLIKNPAI
jgi:hypothetical protein